MKKTTKIVLGVLGGVAVIGGGVAVAMSGALKGFDQAEPGRSHFPGDAEVNNAGPWDAMGFAHHHKQLGGYSGKGRAWGVYKVEGASGPGIYAAWRGPDGPGVAGPFDNPMLAQVVAAGNAFPEDKQDEDDDQGGEKERPMPPVPTPDPIVEPEPEMS